MGSLYELCRDRADPGFAAEWIWKTPVHPRVQLFLWKLVWNRLPTRSLLRCRGVDLVGDCPSCGDPEESTEHAILSCPRARLIWRLACLSQWEEVDGPRLHSFTQFLQQATAQETCMAAYIAYQIWLARNAFTFEGVSTPAQRILYRARLMAREFSEADIDSSSDDPGIWDSLAAPAAALRAIHVCWEPPPPGFVKVNFDGSVRGALGGAGYVIRDVEGRLVAAAGFSLHCPSVPEAELRAAWAGIIRATQQMRVDRIIMEGDSSVIVGWMQDRSNRLDVPPLLRDIWRILHSSPRISVHHVYREANSAADWVASYVADHSTDWTWSLGDCIPPHLMGLLLLDVQGHLRVRQR